MQKLVLLGLGWLIAALNCYAEETLLQVDFGQNFKPGHVHAKGAFDGPLPDGCRPDFPAWNQSAVSSQQLSENGRKFLRFHVTKLDRGVQFSFPRCDFLPGTYRLTLTCRLPGQNLPLGIRQLPSPYTTYWSANVNADRPDWQEKKFLFTFTDKKLAAGVFFYPPTGICDLAALKLVRLDTADLVNAVPRPPTDCRNFFRNSRLPLGLQAGWNLSREFTGGIVEPDAAVPGPSGYPSLKLQTAAPLTLFSEPFQTAAPLTENHVSLAVKGSGPWTVSVHSSYPNTAPLATRRFTAAADWRIETLSFKLNDRTIAAPALVVKISGTGTLYLDSFQAWAGSAVRSYQSQGDCEVALGLPPSEYADTRLQFSDEPARFVYCVTGAFAGAILKFKAVNAFGQEAALPSVPLAGTTKIICGELAFDAFPSAPLGQFRIEAWVERAGQRISPYNELLLTRIVRPIHGREDAPDSPFGTHFMASPLTIKMLKAVGVNWVRFHDAGTEFTGWYHLENEPGKWTFFDREIQRYRNRHIKIFAGLQTAPRWASFYQDSGKTDVNDYFDRYFPPKNMDAWTNYVKTVTSRYKGVIDDYFIWNEPWGENFWHTGYDTAKKNYLKDSKAAAHFAQLSIAAYKAAHVGNPDVRIAGFNACNDAQWTPAVLAAGAYPACDMVDYHFYTRSRLAEPDDQAQHNYDIAVGSLKKADPKFTKPVIMSEGQGNATGNHGGSSYGLYKHALTWNNPDSPLLNGEQTCRFVIAHLAIGCSKVFLYSAHCYSSLAIQAQFVTIIGPDGYPSVETAAYANMTNQLEDKKFIRLIKLNPQVNAYLFQGKTKTVAVISGISAGQYQVPTDARLNVNDLFGNPTSPRYCGTLLYVTTPLPPEQLAAILTRQ